MRRQRIGHSSIVQFVGFALALAALAASMAAPAAAQAAKRKGSSPQVVDARTQPDAAAQQLNDFCAQIQNCSFVNVKASVGLGPPEILGDELYNCGKTNNAQVSVSVGEDRSEETNVSESLSLQVSLGLIGLASSSVEFKATSSQAQTYDQGITTSYVDVVPPGWKGWIDDRPYAVNVIGDVDIVDGIHLVKVTGVNMDFPGYEPPGNPTTNAVKFEGNREPMTASDMATRCGAISTGGGTELGATGPVSPQRFGMSLCSARRRGIQCVKRTALGTPPDTRTGTARLEQHGRTVAIGTVHSYRIRLDVLRPLRRGNCRLIILTGQTRTIVPAQL